MTPEQAFDYMCSLDKHNTGYHIKVQYLKLRIPDELVRLASDNKKSPQRLAIVKDCVEYMFEEELKKHT